MKKKETFGRLTEIQKRGEKEKKEDRKLLQSAGGDRKFEQRKAPAKAREEKPVDSAAEPNDQVIPKKEEEAPSDPKEQFQSETELIEPEEKKAPQEEPPKRGRRKKDHKKSNETLTRAKIFSAGDKREVGSSIFNVTGKKSHLIYRRST